MTGFMREVLHGNRKRFVVVTGAYNLIWGHPDLERTLEKRLRQFGTDGRLAGTDHIFAQHVLGTGQVDPVWPVNGARLSNAAVLESRPRIAPDGAIPPDNPFYNQTTGINRAIWALGLMTAEG